MQTIKFVYWEEDGAWLGYLQEYPDYWTQGETLDDLKDHLRDLYQDLISGAVPSIRADCAMPVLMANCVGIADGSRCAGKTSVWNQCGSLIGQLNESDEGMLIFDTARQALIERAA